VDIRCDLLGLRPAVKKRVIGIGMARPPQMEGRSYVPYLSFENAFPRWGKGLHIVVSRSAPLRWREGLTKGLVRERPWALWLQGRQAKTVYTEPDKMARGGGAAYNERPNDRTNDF
jgi:hypothetical protein